MKRTVIVGAGGMALETAWLIERINRKKPQFQIVGYVDDNPNAATESTMRYPYLGTTEALLNEDTETNVVIAIGKPAARVSISEKLRENKHLFFPNIICDSVFIDTTNQIGSGNIIFSHVKITVDIVIGDFNIIGFHTTIGHGTKIESYNSFYPNATISGNCVIGNQNEFGTGSNIIQNIHLTHKVIIGAGTVVIRNPNSDSTIVGSPAREIR